jgi:CRP-like cAMP-binding protein
MEQQDLAPCYYIWGIDRTAYGPVELPGLVNWLKDERVVADTWVFVELENAWARAAEIAELKMFFKAKVPMATSPADILASEVTPKALRRIKPLANMTEDQLAVLLRHVQVVSVLPFAHVVHRGQPGDAMFGVLQGELRSCLMVDGKERPVATLGPGSVFGEISLFDKGPHAADVIANQDSVLVKISAEALANFGKEAPTAASELLLGLVRVMAGRVRTLTRRYEDSVHLSQHKEALPSEQPAQTVAGG